MILGSLMYTQHWGEGFLILMIAAAVSAVYFSWEHSTWVTGHWLATVLVTGVILGCGGWQRGYILVSVTLCLAFIHFFIRGAQMMRQTLSPEYGAISL